MSNFMKIRPVGAELSHADGQTFRSDFANEPKNSPGSRHLLLIGLVSTRDLGFAIRPIKFFGGCRVRRSVDQYTAWATERVWIHP